MKLLLRICIGLFLLLFAAGLFVFFYLRWNRPQYDGELHLQGLQQTVTTRFDANGIPHIYGANEHDVFLALGYLHAQDRLFQMELLRRVGSGRLAEIFGAQVIEVDRFFRMLGFAQHADSAAQAFRNGPEAAWKQAARAYLQGINQYIEHGKTPLEFRLVGIPKAPFTERDLFLIVGYMTFNFEMGFRTDPLMSRLQQQLGEPYLRDLSLGYLPGTLRNPTHPDTALAAATPTTGATFASIREAMPVLPWTGSNAFVLAPGRSASGKVLFENDTHIQHQQPAVWYEAHLECPGFRFYGNFLAGFPFAPIGRTPAYAWGLTILENDDLDFFRERPDPTDSNKVITAGQSVPLQLREEIIKVKDSADVRLVCRSGPHGPICSDVMKDFASLTKDPVAVSWTFFKFPNNLPEVTYELAHAANRNAFRDAVSKIAAPGLNVLYGDSAGHIAWYTATRFVQRAPGRSAVFLLDGETGEDDWLGFYDFSYNPRSEDPEQGYVFSCNHQPDSVKGVLHPGYYLPEDRASRMQQLLEAKAKHTPEDAKAIVLDVTNPKAARVAQLLAACVPDTASAPVKAAARRLQAWTGTHSLQDVEPVIYYRLLYEVLHNTLADEMGEKDFEAFLSTHIEKNSLLTLLNNDSSRWWDDRNTADRIESRKEIIGKAWPVAIAQLTDLYGDDQDNWHWLRAHTIEIGHPLAKQPPLHLVFGIGSYPIPGGMETINNQSFTLTGKGSYSVNLGPALRRIVDFAQPELGESINPSGQSGNPSSAYYQDQADRYASGKFREELLDRKRIEAETKHTLIFQPK